MDASDVLKFGGAALSWGGHNIYGDSKSIDLVKQYMHEAGTVPELRKELATLRSENERLKAQVISATGKVSDEEWAAMRRRGGSQNLSRPITYREEVDWLLASRTQATQKG